MKRAQLRAEAPSFIYTPHAPVASTNSAKPADGPRLTLSPRSVLESQPAPRRWGTLPAIPPVPYPARNPPDAPWAWSWVWGESGWEQRPVKIPSARYGADPHQRTTTPADGLPEGVRFGAAPMFGMGNPPTLPWAWGWTWMDMWVLRPVWLPPFPQP